LENPGCYNITSVMTHHHHHDQGHAHPPATVAPSLLRASAMQRLAGVALCLAVLWVAVLWAL
jgi:hypothetical protein